MGIGGAGSLALGLVAVAVRIGGVMPVVVMAVMRGGGLLRSAFMMAKSHANARAHRRKPLNGQGEREKEREQQAKAALGHGVVV